MAVSKAKKVEILEDLKAKMANAKSIAFTKNEWLTVEEITSLRAELRKSNSSFTLAKKTLIKIALKEVYGAEIDDSLLPGQVAMLCSNNDAVEGLGKMNSLSKEILNKKDPKIVFVASYFEGSIKDANETKAIASLPSRETLLGRLLGSMMSPLSGLARFLDAAKTELEATGKTKAWDLIGAVKAEKAPAVEEVKTEEKAPETVVEETPVTAAEETPVAEEVVAETPVETVEETVTEEVAATETTEEAQA